MTCKHCCGADRLFDLKGAKKELKKYKKKGPGKSSKRLISFIFANDTLGKSLLDIGGGIGALQWAFFKQGGIKTFDVDASLGYLNVAESYAIENGYMDKAQFILGDFVDKSPEISDCDFVTLDKVVCCYPDYKALLEKAMQKCNGTIGLTYPLSGFIPKLIAQFNKLYFMIKKNPFRTYIHSPKEIEHFIEGHGFKIINKSISFPWHVQIYRRLSN